MPKCNTHDWSSVAMQTERSGKQYTHLSAEKRTVLMVMLDAKHSLRTIAARLGRASSMLSRELVCTAAPVSAQSYEPVRS